MISLRPASAPSIGSSTRSKHARHTPRSRPRYTGGRSSAIGGGGGDGDVDGGGGDIVDRSSTSSTSSINQLDGIEPSLIPFAAQIGTERRFLCTLCGKCCTGSGNVWVSAAEVESLAEHLHISPRRFADLYTFAYSRVPGWRLLRNDPASGDERRCVFLRGDNTCAVHERRPLQCRTYPWWPELMQRGAWELEGREICEGFDHPDAPETDLAEAARQLREATAHDYARRIATPPPRRRAGGGGGAGGSGGEGEKQQQQQRQREQRPTNPPFIDLPPLP